LSRERLGIGASKPNSRESSLERTVTANPERRGRSPSRPIQEWQAEFTYKPKITDLGMTKERHDESSSITDRLYKQSFVANEKLQIMKSMKDEKELSDCTFTPEVTTIAKTQKSDLPVTDRLNRYEQMRLEKLQLAKQQKSEEIDQNCTFKPKIEKTSNRSQSPISLRSTATHSTSFVDRLSTTSTSKKRLVAENEMYGNVTFKPNLISKHQRAPSVRCCDILFKESYFLISLCCLAE
jgi:hypothetical protein